MGGFFTMLQYGVLFPLGGLGYLPGETVPRHVDCARAPLVHGRALLTQLFGAPSR